ncbi:MAG: ferredoxin [Gammaproteobacteria bacterium]|nr:ferredoxin [Gammaproteobacteria bacterium]
MADKNAKSAKNVSGKYYVDTNCISCGQCVDIAGDFFAEDSETGGFYVKAQPGSDEGIVLCENALSNCPVDAIGNDGE